MTELKAIAIVPDIEFKSKLEARFADMLETWRLAGDILTWKYEALTLKIGADCRYTPDFFVVDKDRTITLYETKGSWRGKGQAAARVRLRAAANTFPWFRFIVAYWNKNDGWRYDLIPPLA